MNLPGKKEDLETNNGGFSSAYYSVIQKMGCVYIFENVDLIFWDEWISLVLMFSSSFLSSLCLSVDQDSFSYVA